MLNHKKVLIALACLIVISITTTAVVIAQNINSKFSIAGKISKEKLDKKETYLLVVDGEKISDKDIELVKAINPDASNEDAEDEIVCNKLVYKEALNKGIQISDKEIEDCIIQVKESLKADTNNQDYLNTYIAALGITENEYWEKAKDVYKKLLVINKYKEILENEFKKTIDQSDPEFVQKYLKFYKSHVNELKKKANIEYLYDLKKEQK